MHINEGEKILDLIAFEIVYNTHLDRCFCMFAGRIGACTGLQLGEGNLARAKYVVMECLP